MKYLLRKAGTGKAHYWDGLDTFCRMHSTGGISAIKYTTVDFKPDAQPVCTMCKNVFAKRVPQVPLKRGTE